jgi:superfamily II DNA or RNA helicase
MGEKNVGSIKILDAVQCHATAAAKSLFLKSLSYQEKVYRPAKWQRTANGKAIRIPAQNDLVSKYFITGGVKQSGYFYSGLLPRVKEAIEKSDGDATISGELERVEPETLKVNLNGITLRRDQRVAVKRAMRRQRGVILFPTGSGKTIIATALIKHFMRQHRIVFLVHTLDLLKQTAEEFTRFGVPHKVLGGNKKIDPESFQYEEAVTLVSTIQSFSRFMERTDLKTFFDITIVDEVHHAAKIDSMYGKWMTHNLSPMRIGFTATMPSNEKERLTVEGLFGPVISELKNEEGVKIGILAKPRVNLFAVPYEAGVYRKARKKTYLDIYEWCLVKNPTRNKLIVDKAIARIKRNRVVLIIVESIRHGKRLKRMFRRKKIVCPFVEGDSEKAYRDRVRHGLKSKRLKVAICTRVWKEGINIPSLNTIILAAGQKEEKGVKQAMGRGLRVAEGKRRIELIDFMDPYKYLAEHSVARFTIYKELRWLK